MIRHGGDVIILFARAPELGRVKTRLAQEIGDAAALAAYQELGRTCWSNAVAARSTLLGPRCPLEVFLAVERPVVVSLA